MAARTTLLFPRRRLDCMPEVCTWPAAGPLTRISLCRHGCRPLKEDPSGWRQGLLCYFRGGGSIVCRRCVPGLQLELLRVFLYAGTDAGLLKKIHQDGGKDYFVISAAAARLYAGGVYLACSGTSHAYFSMPARMQAS